MANRRNHRQAPIEEPDIPIIDPGDPPDTATVRMKVREKGTPVRIRAEANINSTHVNGMYLGKVWREIDRTSKGPGSTKGWGHLADGSGWVALDFVEILK